MCKYIKSELSDHPHIITRVGEDTDLGENNVLPGYPTRKRTFFPKSTCLIPTTEAENGNDCSVQLPPGSAVFDDHSKRINTDDSGKDPIRFKTVKGGKYFLL